MIKNKKKNTCRSLPGETLLVVWQAGRWSDIVLLLILLLFQMKTDSQVFLFLFFFFCFLLPPSPSWSSLFEARGGQGISGISRGMTWSLEKAREKDQGRERRRGGEGRGGGVSVDHTLAFKGITELWAHGSAWALWSTLTTNPVTLSFTKSPASSLRATQARTCGCMTQPAAWLSNNGGCVVNQSLLCWDDPRLFVLVRSQSSCLEPILPKFTITAAQSMWAITLPSGNCFKNVRNEFLSCVFCPPHLHLLLLQLQVIITQTCEHQVSQSKHYKAFKQGKTHRTRAAAFHSL